MGRYLNRRTLVVVAVVLILGTFLPPLINVSRFRVRVADALSRALGRPVSIGEVHLRLFPWPGLNLQRLVVQDDPGFSAEPLLRADEVTAMFRLTSLWRGRLEIARLSLAYPSLNLVRSPDGHWNLESLLERARQIPTAPTSKHRAEPRLRFPYIEAEGGRINLKLGPEKTVYALSNADFALSLPSENLWQLNLSARPMRTDANLSDTGSVRVSGTIQRGSTLTDTPLDLRLLWNGAQLGQLTTLIYGRDRGWRGTVNLDTRLQGTPVALKITGDASVDDFRRYDIGMRGALRLAARCTAAFSTRTEQLTDITCHSPVGPGAIDLRGAVAGLLPLRGYAFSLTAKDLPADRLLALAQRMKKDLPEDMQANGSVSAEFELRNSGDRMDWTGGGMATALRLNSKLVSSPLHLGQIRFVLGIPGPERGRERHPTNLPSRSTVLRVAQFPVDLGAAAPAKAQAWFGHDGYNIDIEGDAHLSRLLELAHAFGIRAPLAMITGLAAADLDIAGAWSGFAAPTVSGNLQVRSLTAKIPGIAAPLQLTTAALHLAPDATAIYDMSGSFTGTHLSFTGSLQMPRACAATPCPIVFQLRADLLSTDELNRLLNPRAQKRPWYDIIGGNPSQPALLGKALAVGKLSAARVDVKTLSAKRVSADVRLDSGVLSLHNLRADVLGGSTVGEVRADFTGAEPAYTIRGALQQGSLAAIAAITHDAWATGRANATYRVTASGWDAEQLGASAAGSIVFDWRDGSLARFALAGALPLTFRQFQGELDLTEGRLTFKPSKMETPAGIYVVSGTASLDRQLGLRLMRGKTDGFEVTGTLEKPRVAPVALPTRQAAAIKP